MRSLKIAFSAVQRILSYFDLDSSFYEPTSKITELDLEFFQKICKMDELKKCSEIYFQLLQAKKNLVENCISIYENKKDFEIPLVMKMVIFDKYVKDYGHVIEKYKLIPDISYSDAAFSNIHSMVLNHSLINLVERDNRERDANTANKYIEKQNAHIINDYTDYESQAIWFISNGRGDELGY